MLASVASPAKNDVLAEADRKNVGRHRAYAYDACQSGVASSGVTALDGLVASQLADAL
jgi:hypothetical protein